MHHSSAWARVLTQLCRCNFLPAIVCLLFIFYKLKLFRLQELAALRPKSVEWGVAFEAVRNINSAPSRHLIRPQLVTRARPPLHPKPRLDLRAWRR